MPFFGGLFPDEPLPKDGFIDLPDRYGNLTEYMYGHSVHTKVGFFTNITDLALVLLLTRMA